MGFAYPRASAAIALALCWAAPALADDPKPAAPEGQAQPQHAAAPPPAAPSAKRAPTKQPLPVEVTVEASSPDPPWKLRIANTGDRAIRIPADVRLLALEIEHKTTKGAKQKHKCAAPRAMRPSSFPVKRELYLEPGDTYEEIFDPRLLCFGAATDALAEGTRVKPVFGWSGAAGAKGPWAAQGVDRPEEHAPLRHVTADELELPGTGMSKDAVAVHYPMPAMEREGSENGPASVARYEAVDRNAAQLEIFVERFEDASSPRDVVLTIRAVNEGRRQLATLVRGRMLTFFVEELAHDGSVRSTVECAGQHAPHAIPIEMMQDLRPGNTVRVPILLAEVCPRDAVFLRPGLYRVTPKLDPSVQGEGLEVEPYVADALARQSALIRLATAAGSYHNEPPRSGGVSLDQGPSLDRPEPDASTHESRSGSTPP